MGVGKMCVFQQKNWPYHEKDAGWSQGCYWSL